MLCSSFTDSFTEVFGELARPVEEILWLLWTSGAGLVSLLPGLEHSEAWMRPAESRLAELWGSDTGSWYGLKRSLGRVELRKGFRDRWLAVLVAGRAEAEAAAAAAAM